MGQAPDIRERFKNMDALVLLGAEEVAQLVGMSSANAVRVASYRGLLPRPIVQRHRYVRWGVGQLREFLQTIVDSPPAQRAPEQASQTGKRRGRPRKVVDAETT